MTFVAISADFYATVKQKNIHLRKILYRNLHTSLKYQQKSQGGATFYIHQVYL